MEFHSWYMSDGEGVSRWGFVPQRDQEKGALLPLHSNQPTCTPRQGNSTPPLRSSWSWEPVDRPCRTTDSGKGCQAVLGPDLGDYAEVD